jgi:hypothetical protein
MVKVVDVKKSSKGNEVVQGDKKVEADKNYIVVDISAAIGIPATSEREAVRKAASVNGSGKYVAVEADFVEIFSASSRIELKQDSIDSLFADVLPTEE